VCERQVLKTYFVLPRPEKSNGFMKKLKNIFNNYWIKFQYKYKFVLRKNIVFRRIDIYLKRKKSNLN